MGIKLFSDGPTPTCSVAPQERVTAPNPNPYRFKVLKERHVGECVVALIRYPDCTTFKGEKVLVYDNVERWTKLRDSGVIDPHFLEGSYSPIARFPATMEGWLMAERFVEMLAEPAR